jgi:hypothetical protein
VDQASAFEVIPEDVRSRIKFLEMPMNGLQIMEQATLQAELVRDFSLLTGKYHFDFLFCEKPATLGLFLGCTGVLVADRNRKVVVANIHFAMDTTRNSKVTPELDAAYFSGLLFADAYLFGCGDTCDIDSMGQFRRKLRSLFSGSTTLQCVRKPRWVKPCVDISSLQSRHRNWLAGGGTKRAGFRIHYGYSVNGIFGFEKILSFAQQFRVTNSGVRLIVTTPSRDLGRLGYEPNGWADVYLECPREKFHEIALQSHAFVVWCEYGPGLNHGGIIEMARLGVLPVFFKKSIPYPWDESYPFLFGSEAELCVVMRAIKESYNSPYVQDVIKENQDKIDSLYESVGSGAIIKGLLDLQAATIAEHPPTTPYDKLFSGLPDEFDMEYALDFIKEHSDTHADLRAAKGTMTYILGTRDSIRAYLVHNGFSDVGTPDKVVFRRVSK